MNYTRDALLTIRRNAGHVPREEIATTLGWSVGQLERVASEHGYSLTLPVPRAPSPEIAPAEPAKRREHHHRIPPDKLRSVQVTSSLRKTDVAQIDRVAAQRFLKRSRVAIYIIEGALARGLVDDLVTAALDADRAESPHAEPQVG